MLCVSKKSQLKATLTLTPIPPPQKILDFFGGNGGLMSKLSNAPVSDELIKTW